MSSVTAAHPLAPESHPRTSSRTTARAQVPEPHPGAPRGVWCRASHACVGMGLLALLAGCDRTPGAVPADGTTLALPGAVTDSLRPPVGTGWESAAGPFLVLPTVDGGQDAGSLLRPDATDGTVGDTAGLRGLPGADRVELFSRGSLVGEATITIERVLALDAGCTAWPVARFTSVAGGGSPAGGSGTAGGLAAAGSGTVGSAGAARGWTAGFVKGRVALVPLDSIEGLSSRDSAALAANIARVASGLADDTVQTFRGLPFVVLRAYRGQLNGSSFVIATLVRRLNQEDAPREERLVMVIDGDPAAPQNWTVGWHERAAGSEDELVVSEALVAYQLPGKPSPYLLFGRDDGEALSAAVLVRQGSLWKVLWESALAGCG